MANLLYFRKERPTSFTQTITATNVTNWANVAGGSATSFIGHTALTTAAGGDDIDSKTEISHVTVTADGTNTNVGAHYTDGTISSGSGGSGAIAAGDVTTLDATMWDITDSKLTIIEASGSGGSKDTDKGWTLAEGEIVTIHFATNYFGLEQAFVYPADRFIGGSATNGTTTVLHFNALKGTDNDDTITVTHADGKFTALMAGINDCINANKDDKVQTVIDLMELKFCAPDLGITDLVDAKVSGY